MTKHLDEAIEAVRRLPLDKQDIIARTMRDFAAAFQAPKPMERPKVRRARARVPDVVGMEISKARKAIKSVIPSSHLTLGSVKVPHNEPALKIRENQKRVQPGTVIKQNPEAGADVTAGTIVEVEVAK